MAVDGLKVAGNEDIESRGVQKAEKGQLCSTWKDFSGQTTCHCAQPYSVMHFEGKSLLDGTILKQGKDKMRCV